MEGGTGKSIRVSASRILFYETSTATFFSKKILDRTSVFFDQNKYIFFCLLILLIGTHRDTMFSILIFKIIVLSDRIQFSYG